MNFKAIIVNLYRQKLALIVLSLFYLPLLTSGFVNAQTYKPKKSMPRIIGGIKAPEDAWPWMVALVDGPNNFIDQFCGGALIDSSWVLTAAHCVDEPPFEVLLGVDNLSETGVRIKVKKVYVHPEYLNSTASWVPDLALLELETEADQTPIQLYAGTSTLEGYMATIIGWGATNPDESGYPYDLMQAQVPVVSQQTCDQAYGGIITDYELCAGYDQGGTDSCAGDSGGPLMIQEGGVWKLAGITSWGEGCAQPGFYGVYVRVSEVTDWVVNNMSPDIKGDYTGNGQLGVEDVIGILQELTDLRN